MVPHPKAICRLIFLITDMFPPIRNATTAFAIDFYSDCFVCAMRPPRREDRPIVAFVGAAAHSLPVPVPPDP